MPINREMVGHTVSSSRSYEVGLEKILEFADAIGDDNPAYRDLEAAKALGQPAVIAPPTFPTVIDLHLPGGAVFSPELGLDLRLVVHGEQRYVYERPLRAGDMVSTETRIDEIRDAGKNELLTLVTQYRAADGELICTGYNTIVSRGTAASAQEAAK